MSDFAPLSKEEIEALALSKGCEAVIALPSELQFDLDTDTGREQFSRFIEWANKTWRGMPVLSGWQSKGGNIHRVLKCDAFIGLTVGEKIALQCMGGSDLRREYASLHCLLMGSLTPRVLFRPLTLPAPPKEEA